ncbi:MAG: carboxypeptidase-like regulatory domain-containing protein [Psychroserpens sp.]|uniref:carboxypeptidase-like regulatory domain-containing protein n=1 Tax=Psychroserpens sp. TaxID=2020870 RepID=UPI0030011F00
MAFNCIMVFFLFTISFSFSQTIRGRVNDSIGQPLFANILIKKTSNLENIIQYTTTDNDGNYNLELRFPKDSLILELSSLGFETQIKHLYLLKDRNNKLRIDFVLKEKLNQLDEIVLKSMERINLKKDTITYNVEAFKDGTEKNIEDLLKKLPGIKVESNGEIRFKGKSIKKLLLDGDDLFGANYLIGSRNINVDIIEKVQGIENFEENPLLKGLKDSEDVVLNLTLKEDRTDVSGNTELGYGYKNHKDAYATSIVASKKLKAFSIVSYNDIGKNNSPYNLNGASLLRNQSNLLISAKSLLSEGNFNSILNNSFHVNNSSLFSSTNGIYKVLKKSSIKLNIGVYNDKLERLNKNSTEFSSNSNEISLNNTEKLIKKPTVFSSQFLFTNQEKDSLNWNYKGLINIRKSHLTNMSNNNGTLTQLGELSTNTFTTSHEVNLVSRLDKEKAIEATLKYSSSSAPQELNLLPGSIFETDQSEQFELNTQNSEFKKNIFQSKINYTRKKNKIQYTINSGFNHFNNRLQSSLHNSENEFNSNFTNNMSYKINSIYIFPKLIYNNKRSKFTLSLNLQYNTLNYDDFINDTKIKDVGLVLSPNIQYNYKFSKKISAYVYYSYNETLPEEDNLYSNIIQTDFRSFSKNEVVLNYIKSNWFDLRFKYYDFYSRTTINLGATHVIRDGNYFNESFINQNLVIDSNFYKLVTTKNYSLFFSFETYLHFLKSTLKLNTAYNLSFDKNVINNSELRNITNKNLQTNFIIRTGFKSKLNFENNLSFENNRFEISNLNNNLNTLTNQLKAVYKINKSVYSNTILSFISPNLSNNSNYTFVDTELVFIPENKNLQFSIVGKNLTNVKNFETTSINDYSESSLSYNLIERYIMIKTSFSF